MIQIGNDKIKEIYFGSDRIKEVYHGRDLVYRASKDPRSYLVSTSGVKSYFDLDNTPIDTFCASSSTVVINGSSILKSSIKKIVFGDSYKNVTSIGNYFLYFYTALTSLDLSVFSNVTSISDDFLSYCRNLTSLDLSVFSNVTSIGNSFMSNCRALTSLDLSAFSNVTSIGNSFMSNCRALTSLDLSVFSNVTSIGTYFLRSCIVLTSLDLSAFSNVTSISIYFLTDCSSLTQFKIGAVNVPTTSGTGFLENTTALTTILVPMQSVSAYKTTSPWSNHESKIQGNTQDGYWVHKDTAVKTYFGADADFINNGVMGRPNWLFDAVEIKLCSGIHDFELTEIGTQYPCLVFVDINFETGQGGNNVLQSIDMSNTAVNTLPRLAFYSCTSLTSITFPEGVTSIGNGVFTNCASLTSTTLPDSLTSIEGNAFTNCTSLSLVTSLPTIPPSLGSSVFNFTHANLIIKVPAQSVNAYKTATNWNNYANKITAI